MSNTPLELSMPAKFELERLGRLIDSLTSMDDLKKMSRELLLAWHTQKAATEWMMRQSLGSVNKPVIDSEVKRKEEHDRAALFARTAAEDPQPPQGHIHPL